MRMKLYHFLVNRHSGICSRYHRVHDNGNGIRKLLSYFYLLWMNFCYYFLFCRFLGRPEKVSIYEEKNLLPEESESGRRLRNGFSADEFVKRLENYDIVSFDIFDTLILRPFTEPADLFYFLADTFDILDLKRIRMEQEAAARWDSFQKNGHYEITLRDIWQRMEREVGISAVRGMEEEQRLEMKFCYANPFMKEVFDRLREKGKKIVVVSDMYLSEAFLFKLLEKNGYTGISRLYISCEYGMGKGKGKLFEQVKSDCQKNARIIHVGDHELSDVKMAKKSGFDSMYYPNVNKMALSFRAYDMSPVIGGAYRGIVNNQLYAGLHDYSMEYEYGFIYGGLFVLGYCHFIHTYCQKNQVDKLLFLSRDGDILKQVYDRLYPDEHTSYVYWSRAAATKLMAEHNRYDYFRRYLYHKINQKITLRQILKSMEAERLSDRLEFYADKDLLEKKTGVKLKPEDELTDRNAEAMKHFLQFYFDEIVGDIYQKQDQAAKQYFSMQLAGVKKAAAIDIGWAGSGAMSLAYLSEKVWKLPCELVGIVAGTNTIHNAEPDASEIFLQNGRLVSYLFSQSHNRDVMKKHDLNKDYNVYWELLLSSPTKQFLGFGLDERGKTQLHFGKEDANQQGIREIQRGILDFVKAYRERFGDFPYMFTISGRDAYAPMLVAASHNEKYLKAMEKRFGLEINVN